MTAPRAASVDVRSSLPILIRRHPVARFVLYLALVVSTLCFASEFGQSLISRRSYLGTHPALLDLLSVALEAAIAVIWLAVFVVFAERRKMSDAGFTMRGVTTETISGYLIGMAMSSVVVGLLAVCGAYRVFGVNPAFRPWIPLLTFLLGGIAEETVFRGSLFRIVEYRWGSFVALIVSSVVFGLVHVNNASGAREPLSEKLVVPCFITLEAGLLFGAAYMATRRLWLPIGIHWAWNYFEGPVYGNDVSGTSDMGNALVRSSLHGPFLLSGGSFGPEASIICVIVGLVFGFLLLRVAVRAGQWKPFGQWKPQSEPRVLTASGTL